MMGMDLGMSSQVEPGILPPPEEEYGQQSSFRQRKPEQIDLKKFVTMVVEYFRLQPFTSLDVWNKYVLRPYAEQQIGSMSSLRSIMSLMIRHPPSAIEKDVTLPALHIKTVYLTPTKENRLSI